MNPRDATAIARRGNEFEGLTATCTAVRTDLGCPPFEQSLKASMGGGV
jgi:hypothetical protein